MKKETRNLILLFLFAFILRILFLIFIKVRCWDETVYLSLARDLSSNFFNYSLNGAYWSDYIPFGNFPYSWPNIGFRAPFLSYTLSLFYKMGISNLVKLFIPLVSAFSSVLVYFLGKKIFNAKTGWYSAILFSIIPINLLWGARVSTGVYGLFFLLLSFLFFWKGFEEGDNKSKIFFGIFLALSLLSRYTMMWIFPVFLIYFLVRDKNLKILKDKYLWFAILAFFIILIPWFIYGINYYSNPLGAFIHGVMGSGFWGGAQSLFFYIKPLTIFSGVGLIFVFSLFYFCKEKKFYNKRIYLLLIWFFFFFIVASLVSHKEGRFLLPIIAPLCLLSGYFLEQVKLKNKFLILIFAGVFLISFIPTFTDFYQEEITGTSYCFSEGLDYISSLEGNSVVYTDESPIVYSYTEKETRFYPNPWNLSKLEFGKNNYILYTDYDKPLYLEENVLFREDLRNNLEMVFSCDEDWGITEVYRISSLSD